MFRVRVNIPARQRRLLTTVASSLCIRDLIDKIKLEYAELFVHDAPLDVDSMQNEDGFCLPASTSISDLLTSDSTVVIDTSATTTPAHPVSSSPMSHSSFPAASIPAVIDFFTHAQTHSTHTIFNLLRRHCTSLLTQKTTSALPLHTLNALSSLSASTSLSKSDMKLVAGSILMFFTRLPLSESFCDLPVNELTDTPVAEASILPIFAQQKSAEKNDSSIQLASVLRGLTQITLWQLLSQTTHIAQFNLPSFMSQSVVNQKTRPSDSEISAYVMLLRSTLHTLSISDDETVVFANVLIIWCVLRIWYFQQSPLITTQSDSDTTDTPDSKLYQIQHIHALVDSLRISANLLQAPLFKSITTQSQTGSLSTSQRFVLQIGAHIVWLLHRSSTQTHTLADTLDPSAEAYFHLLAAPELQSLAVFALSTSISSAHHLIPDHTLIRLTKLLQSSKDAVLISHILAFFSTLLSQSESTGAQPSNSSETVISTAPTPTQIVQRLSTMDFIASIAHMAFTTLPAQSSSQSANIDMLSTVQSTARTVLAAWIRLNGAITLPMIISCLKCTELVEVVAEKLETLLFSDSDIASQIAVVMKLCNEPLNSLKTQELAFKTLYGLSSADSDRALLLQHGALQLIIGTLSSVNSSHTTMLWAAKALTHLATVTPAIQSGVAGHVRRLLESNPNQFDARTLVYLQILLQ